MRRFEGIQVITPEEAESVIDTCRPLGLFVVQEGGLWVAIDNSTGDAWIEDFPAKEAACAWLLGKDGENP